MTQKDEALRMAIEAMENEDDKPPIPYGIRIIRAINACKAALSEPEQVSLPKIDYDADMDRYYIPMPAGWEMQTKGKGSSFRLCDTKTGERYHVTDTFLQQALEQMAREMHEASKQVSLPDGYFYTSPSGVDGYFFGEMHEHTKDLVKSVGITNVKPFYLHGLTLPDGWVPVPIEPDRSQLDEIEKELKACIARSLKTAARCVYKTFIKSAPKLKDKG